jgi:hypothetical protein
VDDGADDAPLDADRDDDGLIDGFELLLHTDPDDPDSDDDGLLDGEEYHVLHTDPNVADTDGDGLDDGAEVNLHGTNPLEPDSDYDGLSDKFEVTFDPGGGFAFDPMNATDVIADWDGDGLTNLEEYLLNPDTAHDNDTDGTTDFVDPDDDGDTIPTIEELFYGSGPYLADASGDLDGDGLNNGYEYANGLDYGEPDTDGDGLDDGWELDYWRNQRGLSEGVAIDYALNPDVDGDGVYDGDEVDGWYVYVQLANGTLEERHVTSDPLLEDTDGDGLNDTMEYLRMDPRSSDTDGDGLVDALPWLYAASLVPPGYDDDPVVPEDIPPRLSDMQAAVTIEWAGIIVAHTWLHLSIQAEDDAALDTVTFRLVDANATQEGVYRGNDLYATTFEIDFWMDYVAGYEVEVQAWDVAGNVAGTMTGGGLEYVVEGLVASFLAFLTGPEMAGGVIGFFVGFGAGLYEDLTIFLQVQEMWEGIRQMPALIGQLIGDASLLLQMVEDMLDGILAKANLINPYGPSSMNATTFAAYLVEAFWWYVDPANNAFPSLPEEDRFNLAFVVSHLTGYIIQQFIVGTGLLKVVGKLNDLGKFAKITKKLEGAVDTLKDTVGKVGRAAKATAKKAVSGVARTAAKLVDRLPFKWTDDMAEGLYRVAGRWGTSLGEDILRQLDDADELLVLIGKVGGNTDLAKQNQRAIESLMKTAADHPVDNFRKGARFHLDRLKHYGDDVDKIEVKVGKKRVDIQLKDGTIIEVKDVSAATFHKNLRTYAKQLEAYREATGKPVLLELKQWVDPKDVYTLLENRDWLTVVPGVGS